MRAPLKAGLTALLTGALLAAPVSAASAQDSGNSLDIVGLVDGTTLVTFSSDDTTIRDSRDVTGLAGDDRLVGIDYRVQDGNLYGVGDKGGIYTIDDRGQAAPSGTVSRLSVGLDGASFGVDFNPAANALRVVSDTGQNLRQPFAMPNTATAVDGPLTNPATPPAMGTVAAFGVTGAGYTNNDVDPATATTLFDVDTTLDRVSIQSPANAGTLVPTGNLGVDAGPEAGFDVYSTVRDEKAVDLVAFATLQVGDEYGLYEIDLLTGGAAKVGGLDRAVADIAIPLDQR